MQETSSSHHNIAEPHLGSTCLLTPPLESHWACLSCQWATTRQGFGSRNWNAIKSSPTSSLYLVLYLMIILILIGCVVFVVPARYTFIFFLPRTGKRLDFFLKKKSVSNERFKLWEASKTSSKTEGWITEPFFFFLWLYKLLRDKPTIWKIAPSPTPHCLLPCENRM